MQYRGVEYEVTRRSDDLWEWAVKAPDGKQRSGTIKGQRQWAELTAARAIDVWLAENTTPHLAAGG